MHIYILLKFFPFSFKHMQFNLIYVTLSQTLHTSKAGRIKSVCDGVGGNVKTEVQAVALAVHRTSEKITIHPADDVKKVITNKNNLTYDVPVNKNRSIESLGNSAL